MLIPNTAKQCTIKKDTSLRERRQYHQQSKRYLRQASLLLLPLNRTLLQLIEEPKDENEEKEEYGQQNRQAGGEKFTEHQDPWNEKHHLDIEEDEQHGRNVEFDRKACVPRTFGEHTALVGRILNRRIRAPLTKNVRRQKNHRAYTGGDGDLDQNWIIVSDGHDP